ncbi:hypothetical protein R9C00_18980 [Flammeovirgaceae bacterium SG7u.111]|nr:hypothetical protein [Flammeovirgaceae bacterium SG7u.132]WPO33785.1 hypothetical protein R9C00_18980 [Flammeovirgaceae bacterium SG7u.111]
MKNINKQPPTPAPAAPKTKDQFDFIKHLELYYYGESVDVIQSAKKLVGEKGQVHFTVKKPVDFEGTDYTAVKFKLMPAAGKSSFKLIEFSLLVNQTSGAVVDVIEAHKDRQKLDEKGLIITLGRFSSAAELDKNRKIVQSFMNFLEKEKA